ncbi:MAG: anthranilate phosphoribosyltransferase family protein [Cyanophyceae cyanobacterium]
MSSAFRELLKKTGSGPHTGKNLSREEAKEAAILMLTQEATPAQIGGFLIAHRIRRPTPIELAGMLDAYDELGPVVPAIASENPVCIFGNAYDGRSRTFPLGVGVALTLAAAGYPVLLHGGVRMPSKYGLPTVDIWSALGVDWRSLSLDEVHHYLQSQGLGFLYLPKHFPLAHGLVQYREEIGKRPPLATLELMWTPYGGENMRLFAGYVHTPTEVMMRDALKLRGAKNFATIKGLEGSCDLPSDRNALAGIDRGDTWERLVFKGRQHDLREPSTPFPSSLDELQDTLTETLQGKPTEIQTGVIWNAGIFLWLLQERETLAEALEVSRSLVTTGAPWDKLNALKAVLKN